VRNRPLALGGGSGLFDVAARRRSLFRRCHGSSFVHRQWGPIRIPRPISIGDARMGDHQDHHGEAVGPLHLANAQAFCLA
jgi:hypothetical protein